VIIQKIHLWNFGCYRGNEHCLMLEPKAYGVSARVEGDDERSNWVGKSTLLRAIVWCLYGTRDRDTTQFDDDVGTDDRDGGKPADRFGVRMVLGGADKELVVERNKRRGQPEKLRVHVGREENWVLGAEAQKLIVERVGLSERDFCWTAYFEQKKIARFLQAKPAERLELAAEWFRFEKLQEAEDQLRRELARESAALDLLRTRITTAIGELDRLEQTGAPGEDAVRAAELDLERVETERERVIVAGASVRDLRRYVEVVRLGQDINQKLEAYDTDALRQRALGLRQQVQELAGEERVAYRDLQQKRELVSGQFDGKCPVSGCGCPIAQQINDDLDQNIQLRLKAEDVYAKVRDRREKLRIEYETVETDLREIERLVMTLGSLREEARRLKGTAKLAAESQDTKVVPGPELDQEVAAARQRLVEARTSAELTRMTVLKIQTLETAVRDLTRDVEAGERRIATLREAIAVFGRNGAQRVIAEGALQQIQEGANRMLSLCGIDLSMRVRWGREGRGLAQVCDACGTTFPKSERVRRCDRCGADRGPAVQHRLDLEPSNRSGGADDLCGIAFQLAAARWLREDRCCGWSTILVDEPFGALDLSNRRALATHLATALAAEGFGQAIVIAHNTAVVDSLPGRIEVVRHRDASLEVKVS
jgi:DNA repair exonuclease SbcCD ATPase subunit